MKLKSVAFFKWIRDVYFERIVLHVYCLNKPPLSTVWNTWARTPVFMYCWWELSPALLWCPGLCCWGGSSSQPLQPCPSPSDLDTTWFLCPILHPPCRILLRCLSIPYEQTKPSKGCPTLNRTPSFPTSATAGVCRRRSGEGRRPWWEETPLP